MPKWLPCQDSKLPCAFGFVQKMMPLLCYAVQNVHYLHFVQSSQWSHLQSAWPRCMRCQKKNPAKRCKKKTFLQPRICWNIAQICWLQIWLFCQHCQYENLLMSVQFKRLIWNNYFFPWVPFIVILQNFASPSPRGRLLYIHPVVVVVVGRRHVLSPLILHP